MVSVSEFMFVLYDVRLFKQRHGKIERLLILEVEEGTSSNLGVHAEGVEQRRLRQNKIHLTELQIISVSSGPKASIAGEQPTAFLSLAVIRQAGLGNSNIEALQSSPPATT